GLRYGDPERAGGMRLLAAPRTRERARRAVHGRAPGLHHRASVGLLVIGGADHEDLAVEPEQRAGEGEGRAPLARSRLGRQALDPSARVLVRLGYRRVWLVGAGGRDPLVLVVDARGRAQLAL